MSCMQFGVPPSIVQRAGCCIQGLAQEVSRVPCSSGRREEHARQAEVRDRAAPLAPHHRHPGQSEQHQGVPLRAVVHGARRRNVVLRALGQDAARFMPAVECRAAARAGARHCLVYLHALSDAFIRGDTVSLLGQMETICCCALLEQTSQSLAKYHLPSSGKCCL
jgi:hypothetical protein